MANPRSIEVKVGLLILIAIGILTGFIVLMGGMSFQPTYRVYVDFDNPGGIQSGSPVRIAGVTVGKIKDIQFRGGAEPATDGQRPALVRMTIAIETRHREAVRENATFYVTSQGVLGEQFLAIDPGSRDRPVLADEAVVRGLDPPRLDLLLAEGYELLHTTITAMRDNRAQIEEMFKGLHSTLTGTGEFFDKNRDRLTRIAENVETITIETNELVRSARTRYVDGPQVTRIISNIDHASAAIARDSEPLLRDARTTMANVNRVSGTVGAPEEQQKIKQTIQDVAEIASRAKLAAADAQAIVAHVKKGKGSVGALVMDEQVYDDLQEMVRDLKHNPWKFFWRE
jgi:phospholipid/cholesterol/gamma-HCH transport system substrate-binding protein